MAWQILLSDTVTNALLSFLLGGEVPGTNIILSPEAMLWSAAAIAGLVALVIAARTWSGHRRLRRVTKEAATQAPLPLSVPIRAETIAEPIAAVVEPAPKKVRPKRQNHRIQKGMRRLAAWYDAFIVRLKPVVRTTARRLKRVGHTAFVYAIGVYELTRIQTIKLTKKARVGLAKAWIKAKPQLLRFDTWLEKKYVQCDAWLTKHLSRNEFMQLYQEVLKHLKKLLLESPLPDLYAKAKAQFQKLLSKAKS